MPVRRTPFQHQKMPGMDEQGCSLEVATWVNGVSGTETMQRDVVSRHAPFAPSEAQNVNRNCFVCQQERFRDCRWLWGRFPGGSPCTELASQTDAGSPAGLKVGPDGR